MTLIYTHYYKQQLHKYSISKHAGFKGIGNQHLHALYKIMYNQHQQYYNYTLFTIDTKLVGVNTPLGHPQIKCDRPPHVHISVRRVCKHDPVE